MSLVSATQQPCNCCGSNKWEYCFSQAGYDLGRCSDCGLYYVNPMPSAQHRRNGLVSGTYGEHESILDAEKQQHSEKFKTTLFETVIRLTQQHAPSGSWIELGCGAGSFIKLATGKGITIEGIELNSERNAWTRQHTRCTIHDKPIEELQLPKDSYAAVVAVDVFSHFIDPMTTMTEIFRILKPGGVFVMHTTELDAGAQIYHQSAWNLGDHLFFLGRDTVARYSQKIGFEIIDKKEKWLPEFKYSYERFNMKGRSAGRDLLKKIVVSIPGVLPAIRWHAIRYKEADNPGYTIDVVLQKPGNKITRL